MTFIESLRAAWQRNNSLVCVGLDPEPARFPARFAGDDDAVFAFCRDIVDATADLVCCFKPQIAHFAALGIDDADCTTLLEAVDRHPGGAGLADGATSEGVDG